jgi:hypothetical protein
VERCNHFDERETPISPTLTCDGRSLNQVSGECESGELVPETPLVLDCDGLSILRGKGRRSPQSKCGCEPERLRNRSRISYPTIITFICILVIIYYLFH